MYRETHRAAWAEIRLENINANYRFIRGLAHGSKVIACVKADAYGHGLIKIAEEFAREGTEYLGVATLGEAAALRNAGITTPVVLLSAVPRTGAKEAVDLEVIPVVTTGTDAKLLSEAAAGAKSPVPFFAGVETGMGRLGFMPSPESVSEIAAISALPGIQMEGLFSHFATADEADLSFAHAQLSSFSSFDNALKEAGIKYGKRTMSNSAALINLPESHFEIVRPGIALYGLYPSKTMDKKPSELKPAMSVKANIVYLKKVPAGFHVSYGSHFVTQRESLIATLPLGYGDGLPRNQGGRARIIVRGQYAPIAGAICMDQCMADVTDIAGVSEYDEAVIMGTQNEAEITAWEIAENTDTIPYEILCRFGQRLPRKYL